MTERATTTIVVMGVSGCGRSTVGQPSPGLVAERILAEPADLDARALTMTH